MEFLTVWICFNGGWDRKINMWKWVGCETFKIALTALSGLIPWMQTLSTLEPPHHLGVEILNKQTKTANESGRIKGSRDVGDINHLFICKKCRSRSVCMQITCNPPSQIFSDISECFPCIFFFFFFIAHVWCRLADRNSFSLQRSSCKLGTHTEGWIVPWTRPSY